MKSSKSISSDNSSPIWIFLSFSWANFKGISIHLFSCSSSISFLGFSTTCFEWLIILNSCSASLNSYSILASSSYSSKISLVIDCLKYSITTDLSIALIAAKLFSATKKASIFATFLFFS